MAKAARKSARPAGRDLKATASKRGVQLQVSGHGRGEGRNGGSTGWNGEAPGLLDGGNEVFEFDKGMLSYDHARIAAARAKRGAGRGCPPEGHLLGSGVRRAHPALHPVDPLPEGKRGLDSGFQRPRLCWHATSETATANPPFCAHPRRTPNVPLAMVYVPGHALVGVGIKPQKGDRPSVWTVTY